MSEKWKDAPRRFLTISIGAPSVFFIMYIGNWWYDGLVLIVGILSALEIQKLISSKGIPIVPLMVIGVSIILSALGQIQNTSYLILTIMIFIILSSVWQAVMRSSGLNSKSLIALIIASIYVGFPLAALLDIRGMPNGLAWTYMLFVNNWATDAFALISGRLFGRRKLAPEISAGKTVEGVVIGLLLGIVSGLLVVVLFDLPFLIGLYINITIAVLTIIGDLIESIFKRYYQVKDTGFLLPGHGGFLDRIDGLVISIIPLYAVLLLIL